MTISLSDVKAELRGDIVAIVYDEITKLCEQTLREVINSTVYASIDTEYYTNTMQLSNVVKVEDIRQSGDSISFLVTLKGNMLSPRQTGEDEWNQHMGVKGQSFNNDTLIEILDEGGGSSLYQHGGYGFFDKAESKLDDLLILRLASAMRGRGWDVKMG